MANSTTNIDQISSSQSAKEVVVNALVDSSSPATNFGRHASACSGLTWGYYGGTVLINGTPTQFANGTIALTASVTNYLYLTPAAVVTKVTSAPTGWPGPLVGGNLALYAVVTGATSVTSYTDYRTAQGASVIGGSGGGGGQNMLVNGGLAIWQTGTSFAVTSSTPVRTADNWWSAGVTGVVAWTVSQVAGTKNRYAMKIQRNNANATLTVVKTGVSLETRDCIKLAKGLLPVTLSFWAKAGANFSAAGSNLVAKIIRGTGTDEQQVTAAGYTGSSTLATLTQPISTTLIQYSLTAVCDASTNELAIEFSFTPVGTAGADDSVTIETVQLEIGSSPSAFQYKLFSEWLQLCQRYVWKTFDPETTPATNVNANPAFFTCYQSGTCTFGVVLPVQMRVASNSAAAFTFYSPNNASNNVWDFDNGVARTPSWIRGSIGGFQWSLASGAVNANVGAHFLIADNTF